MRNRLRIQKQTSEAERRKVGQYLNKPAARNDRIKEALEARGISKGWSGREEAGSLFGERCRPAAQPHR
jgi:hypothetical protein